MLDQREPAREIVERAERLVLEVAHDERQQDFRSISSLLHDELDKLHELSVAGESLTGTPTGFTDLDRMTGGFQPGNLVVIAARPSMGKSCLVTNIAENAAINHGKPVALFSLEMSEAELARRFIASQASVQGEELARAASARRAGRRSSRRARAWPRRRCGSTTPATSACSRSARRRAACTAQTPTGSGW